MSRQAPNARIFQQPKSAMQSGRAQAAQWVLTFVSAEAKRLDPLTGWPGSGDTQGQVVLRFPTAAAAIAFAEAKGIGYDLETPPPVQATIKPRAYADNFKFGRTENWSH